MFRALLSASFVLAVCSIASAQSGSEQSILFSSPDGQTSSNAVLPVVQAPQTGESDMGDQPSEASMVIAPTLPGQRPAPFFAVMPNKPRNPKDQDGTMETPADIIGAPSLRQIFGLPEVTAQTNLMSGNTATNLLPPGGTLSGDLGWAKILTSDPNGNSSTATNSQADQGTFSGLDKFFDSTPAENPLHRKKEEVSDFGASPFEAAAAAQQPAWDSYAQPPAPAAPAYSPSVAAPQPVFNFDSGFNSQSPFALPKSSAGQTMPQLPSLPSVYGQYTAPSQPVVPSWAPKPPPWSSSAPTPGTMPQRQF
jgi:hypothetical protein